MRSLKMEPKSKGRSHDTLYISDCMRVHACMHVCVCMCTCLSMFVYTPQHACGSQRQAQVPVIIFCLVTRAL